MNQLVLSCPWNLSSSRSFLIPGFVWLVSLSVCVSVYLSVYLSLCWCAWLPARVCVHVRVHVRTLVCACMYLSVFACRCPRVRVCVCVLVSLFVSLPAYLCVFMHVQRLCVHACETFVCTSVCLCAFVCHSLSLSLCAF